ncbi:MAG: ABC transporter permease [Candidatus Acidiferrales bacterium]
MRLIESIYEDIRYALRMMRSSAGLTAVAVLSLALGIGTTVAIFSVMYALILKPLPVMHPEQLVDVLERSDGFDGHSYPEWKELQKRQDIFSGVFAYNYLDTDFKLMEGQEEQRVDGAYVTGDYFTTLGVPAILGRTLVAADDQPGAAPVCVIGYGLWKRMYGGSRSVIGRMLVIDGHGFQVVGVAPRWFFGVDVGDAIEEVFAPLEAERTFKDYQMQWGRHTPPLDSPATLSFIVGRLKPGVSVSQADARLRILGREVYNALPPHIDDRTGRPFPMALSGRAVPNGLSIARETWSETVVLLLTMAAALLLIACTNLGNLLLARATRRQGEIATRLALGATRWRLIRQLLTESVALAAAGAVAGLIAAHWGSEMLLSAISWPDEPTVLDLSWDWKLVAFAVGTTLLCALLFGLAPAVRATRISLYSAMHNSSSGSATGKIRNRFSNRVLIVAQVTLSMALLASAGLLVRTLEALMAKDPGYDAKNVLTVGPGTAVSSENAARQELVGEELLENFRALPGVISASRSAVDSNAMDTTAIIPQPGGSEFRLHIYQIIVSPGFFQTRRTPILMGRDFGAGDNKGSISVVILSEEAAKEFFAGKNPVGLRFQEKNVGVDGQEHFVEVVGVVKDIDYQRPSDVPLRIVYEPVAQCSSCGVGSYELRYAGALPDLMKRAKSAAAGVDTHLALNFHLLSDQINGVVKRNRVTALLAMFFGLLTAALAMIGVYGVTSYATSQRTREIGIRMTLGAQPGDVFRMILGETITVVFVGVALGVAAGLGAAQTIRGMLWGVTASDPLTFVSAGCVMLLVAGVAAFLPARRASKADPMIALRFE